MCSGPGPAPDPLDLVADRYVRLVLAVGRHDEHFVDAYYGPPEWKSDAAAGTPRAVPELAAEARALLERTREAPASGRARFLERQLVAVEAFLRRLAGERSSLDEEARLLYDIAAPRYDTGEIETARAALEALLPGPGDLGERLEAFRARFVVPADRLEAVTQRCLELVRERTLARISLPPQESFRASFVRDKPWGAYNWYAGSFHSRIEVNTDLPIELGRHFDTMAHEGYPGHHTYNALLEAELVRGKGWREFTVYPLYSPQSLIAEGTANAGMSVILSDAERLDLLKRELSPLAGLAGEDFDLYEKVRRAGRPLRYARGEAARMLFEGGASDEETARFLSRYALETMERARKSVAFLRTYGAYIFTYTVGEDLVREHIGEGPDRERRFFDLLRRPVVPSELGSPGTTNR